MTFQIKLSERSKKILRQLGVSDVPDCFDLLQLNEWLSEEKANDYTKKSKFMWESLKPVLSYDLKAHLKKKNPDLKKKKKTHWFSYVKFAGLLIAGTLLEAIEGFNGIASVMGLISKTLFSIPGIVTLIIGSLFSLVSVGVFYAFELTQIAKHFGINFGKARGLLDIYVDQLSLMRDTQREIGTKISNADLIELQNYQDLLLIVDKQYMAIAEARDKFKKQIYGPKIEIAKAATAVTAGILYFAGGYFSGSAIGVTLVSFIMGTAISATFWPVIFIAAFIAGVATCIYWFVERPSLQNLIGRVMGLDSDKFDKLSDKKDIKNDNKNWSNLMSFSETRTELLLIQNSIEHPQSVPSLQTNSFIPVKGTSDTDIPSVTLHSIFCRNERSVKISRNDSKQDAPDNIHEVKTGCVML